MNTQRNNRPFRAPSRGAAGFTLLELIVVITIIGILGTIVVVNVTGSVDKARIAKIKQDLRAIYSSAETYYYDTGSYPETIDDMRAAEDPNGQKLSQRLQSQTLDPWNNEYYFELRNGEPVVYCLGKDQAEGGEGEDEDFYYPEQSDSQF